MECNVEKWTEIKDAIGYEISNQGRVRNSKTRKILKTYLNRPGGYERVDLRGKHRYIHKLMIENIYGYELKNNEIIRYRDKNKRNNTPQNFKIVEKNVKNTPTNRG